MRKVLYGFHRGSIEILRMVYGKFVPNVIYDNDSVLV